MARTTNLSWMDGHTIAPPWVDKTSKLCSRCLQEKPLAEFGWYVDNRYGTSRPKAACRECGRDKSKGEYARKIAKSRPCSKPDCEKPATNIGMCAMHYRRHQREERWGLCTVEEDGVRCTRDQSGKGMCPMHTKRLRLFGDAGPVSASRTHTDYVDGDLCSENRCDRPAVSHWLCASHYASRIGKPKRRARKVNAPGTHTVQDRRQIWAAFNGRCWMCGDPATAIDHVQPLSKGGSDGPENLRPACKPCNSRKGRTWPVDLTIHPNCSADPAPIS